MAAKKSAGEISEVNPEFLYNASIPTGTQIQRYTHIYLRFTHASDSDGLRLRKGKKKDSALGQLSHSNPRRQRGIAQDRGSRNLPLRHPHSYVPITTNGQNGDGSRGMWNNCRGWTGPHRRPEVRGWPKVCFAHWHGVWSLCGLSKRKRQPVLESSGRFWHFQRRRVPVVPCGEGGEVLASQFQTTLHLPRLRWRRTPFLHRSMQSRKFVMCSLQRPKCWCLVLAGLDSTLFRS